MPVAGGFLAEPGAAGRLRDCLDGAGFTLDALVERLGPHAFAHLSAREPAPGVRATRAGDRLDVLARLFVLGVPVPRAAAQAALAPLAVGEAVAGGVVAVAGDEVAGRIALRPLGGPANEVVAHDLGPAAGEPVAADHVLGISASTQALSGATIRRPVAAALDLGTGCGVQALQAAAHSGRVVASDLNPRAVALCRLTMALNGAGTVDVRQGDLFAPVAGETFGLIVANPPFVISPSTRYLFRDGGDDLDGLCRRLVRTAPTHLAEGGHCQLLASWAQVAGEDWRDRLAGWFAGTACDALVLAREVLDPGAHAAGWLRQTEPAAGWQPQYDEWMAYYERHRIEAVGLGLVTLRRRADGDGEGWFRAEEAPQDLAMPCGDHLGAAFELADFVAAHPGDGLLGAVLRVAPDVVLDERAAPAAGGGGWTVSDRRLRQTAGLCREGEIDGALAAILAACDGTRAVGAVVAGAAGGAGVDPDTLAGAVLPPLRRLVEQGFVLPLVG